MFDLWFGALFDQASESGAMVIFPRPCFDMAGVTDNKDAA